MDSLQAQEPMSQQKSPELCGDSRSYLGKGLEMLTASWKIDLRWASIALKVETNPEKLQGPGEGPAQTLGAELEAFRQSSRLDFPPEPAHLCTPVS